MENITNLNRPIDSNRVSSLSKEIVRKINDLEYKHKKLMRYFNPNLEERAWVAINTKNTIKMEKIIKEFNDII